MSRPGEDERRADELQRRGSFVDEQRGEEHGEQRLEREEHGGPRRGQPSQRDGDQEPADDLRAQRERQKPQGRLERRREVEVAQDQAGGDDEDGARQRGVVERPGDAAALARAPSQSKQEARVGDPGEQAEDRAELRVASVGAVLQNTRDEQDSEPSRPGSRAGRSVRAARERAPTRAARRGRPACCRAPWPGRPRPSRSSSARGSGRPRRRRHRSRPRAEALSAEARGAAPPRRRAARERAAPRSSDRTRPSTGETFDLR